MHTSQLQFVAAKMIDHASKPTVNF